MKKVSLLLILVLTFVACSDEDYTPLPAYVHTLGELQTNESGHASVFIPDGGTARRITSTHTGLTHDSIYRVQALVIYDGVENVSLRQVAKILSPKPRTFTKTELKYAPVDVQSLWSSGRYINMRLALRTATEPHAFAFVDEGIENTEDGKRLLRLHLYHDRGENPEYYTREVYLSCPVYHYGSQLQTGRDSIIFTVSTYEGERTLRVVYGQ